MAGHGSPSEMKRSLRCLRSLDVSGDALLRLPHSILMKVSSVGVGCRVSGCRVSVLGVECRCRVSSGSAMGEVGIASELKVSINDDSSGLSAASAPRHRLFIFDT